MFSWRVRSRSERLGEGWKIPRYQIRKLPGPCDDPLIRHSCPALSGLTGEDEDTAESNRRSFQVEAADFTPDEGEQSEKERMPASAPKASLSVDKSRLAPKSFPLSEVLRRVLARNDQSYLFLTVAHDAFRVRICVEIIGRPLNGALLESLVGMPVGLEPSSATLGCRPLRGRWPS